MGDRREHRRQRDGAGRGSSDGERHRTGPVVGTLDSEYHGCEGEVDGKQEDDTERKDGPHGELRTMTVPNPLPQPVHLPRIGA